MLYTGASDGRIAVSKNVNATTTAATAVWTVIDKAPLPARFVTDIEVAESDPTGNTAYVTFSGFNSGTPEPGHVFKTVNGLSASPTWTNITGDLPDVPANAVALLPTATGDEILVGTDIGVFWSDNGGTNWRYLNDGHPAVAVFALDRSRTTGQVVSSTHGRGMFELRAPNGTVPGDGTAPVCSGSIDGGDPAKFNGSATDNAGIASVQFLPGITPKLSLGSISYSGPTSVSYVVTNAEPGCLVTGGVQVTDSAGWFCRQVVTFAGPVKPSPTASNNGPLRIGQTLQLTASTVAGGTYAWTGPNGFTSSLQNPTIASVTAAATGVYRLTVTVGTCVSAEATTTLLVQVVPSDFNADGKTDLLWQDQTNGDLYAWYMNGTTRTSGSPLSPGRVADLSWIVRGIADLNADGSVDLLWQNGIGDLYIWYMNGLTRVSTGFPSPSRINPVWVIRGLADFNRDGSADILWRNSTTGDLYVWLMNGAVQSAGAPVTPGRVATAWDIRGLADMDGDGHADIVWHNGATGALYVWFMEGLVQKGTATVNPSPVNLSWQLVQVADFNADQKPDFLWRNQLDGQNLVWLMDGINRTSIVSLDPAQLATKWVLQPR